jgi:hypothetical protein
MVQAFNHTSRGPINFLLPDFMAQWPYERRLHPDYGTVDVESADWVNDLHLFSEKAQKSFNRSLFGEYHLFKKCSMRLTLTISISKGLLGCLVFPLHSRGKIQSVYHRREQI